MVKIVVPEDDLGHFYSWSFEYFYQKRKGCIYFPRKCQGTCSMALSMGPRDYQWQESSQIFKKNSWLLMRLFRSFQEYLQSCSMENQYKSLKVDYIYRSIQEDVPSSLHWFLLVHPSSERIKQNEQLQNLFLSIQLVILIFICIS